MLIDGVDIRPPSRTPPRSRSSHAALATLGCRAGQGREEKEKKDKKQKAVPEVGSQTPGDAPPEDDVATGPPGGGEVAEEVVEVHEVATDRADVDEVWDTEAAAAEGAAAEGDDEIAERQPQPE